VRCFKQSTVGPRSTASRGAAVTGNQGTAADPDQDPLPFGGNVLVQGGVEVMFPLPFIKVQRSLRTSVFWDVGNVFDSNCDSNRRTASGERVECN
ncbi:BamA/TamA family outer membrane protein, partial [Pseudomonas viridiflava]|uniref:BamA/TamA family outer membrane protein n=1 Tax=Pseudomonas viridiflava TaxID=33069 RepID=UPI0013CE42D4